MAQAMLYRVVPVLACAAAIHEDVQMGKDISQRRHAGIVRAEGRSGAWQAKPGAFSVTVDSCGCDLRELNCLPAPECLQSFVDASERRVALGAAVRKRLQSRTQWSSSAETMLFNPLGKAIQYSTIESWKSWLRGLPVPYHHFGAPKLVEWQWYPHCKEKGLHSVDCFFADANASEDLDGDRPTSASEKDISETVAKLELLRSDATNELPADSYLLSFAHFLHMGFNIRPETRALYEEKLRTVKATAAAAEERPLKVALHVRRADSCRQLSRDQYETSASGLSSNAQVSGHRMCYQTRVYVAALKQIAAAFSMKLEVYLATDDTDSVLAELEDEESRAKLPGQQMLLASDVRTAAHDKAREQLLAGERVLGAFRAEDEDFYHKTTWRILNYSRDAFKYEGYIESVTRPFMTETAIMDLWHLSHGEAFVGQLGSRFGKVGYLLAVARQNSAVPYASVDGHNLCCEVDEVCAVANGAMQNMTNCLTFAHELSKVAVNGDYWTVGSTVRGRSL
eukprot:TRINITY_DN38438_c0_g1_i1.p1 TRINITY_DN38438_c0_g1~~TRINITY_DN38438_c0_g1_i1.p1  ORF type:complete len:532 (-),score=106.59 TRINITY_DN38438_c0_g1_i1:41-1570(-)